MRKKPKPLWAVNLRRARVAAGLTQQKAAELCQVTLRTWSNYEAARHKPHTILLSGYHDAINKSIDIGKDCL